MQSPDDLKVATLNIRGATDPEKFINTLLWIDSNNFDITFLTETKITQQTLYFHTKNFKKKYSFYSTINPDVQRGSGIIAIANKLTIGKHIYHHTEVPGRAITLWCKYKNKMTLTLTGIYGPAQHDPDSRKLIIKHIKSISDYIPNITAGDFNEDPSNTKPYIIDALLSKGRTLIVYQQLMVHTWENQLGTKHH